VVAYIDANLSHSIRVADLAGIVQLSISHFFRAFRESFGQSPLAYVKVRRIRHAQILLLSTREPLSQVALDSGMCDQSHFTRVFHSVAGVSPSLWRRQYQSGHTSAAVMLRQTIREVAESKIATQLVRNDPAATGSSQMRRSGRDMGASGVSG
jgi:AraC-like DNA-binding protein